MMIKRECSAVLKKLTTYFPVVSVTGPRQSGKTTLVKDVFSEKEYVSLEHPEVRKHAENDPQDFLNQFPRGVIIDEVQRVPDLFSYIQVIVDENKEMGFYVLTGSNQFEYMQNISQSLAGRISIIKLLPFSYLEIYDKRKIDRNEILVKGMYPAIFDRDIPATKFYPSYIETYLERDVRQIKNVTDLSLFHKFLELCAGRTGQVLNRNSLANECGVSQPTIEKWLTILEASFIMYRMPSYFKNIKKRIVKSPKLYFFDTGLVCNLLGIFTPQQLRNHPLRGEIFETFVVSELLKYHYHKGQRSNYYFYRDNHMNEIDVIIDTGYGPVPLEIKSGMTINDSFFKGLDFFRKLASRYKNSGLIYGGNRNFKYKNYEIRDYSKVYEMYESLTADVNWRE